MKNNLTVFFPREICLAKRAKRMDKNQQKKKFSNFQLIPLVHQIDYLVAL